MTGHGRPGLPPPCIEILDCSATPCTVLGTGGTDANGNFTIPLSDPLRCGERLFARDVCNMPPLTGPVFIVICKVAPAMSPAMILVLVTLLGIVGLLQLARLRWTQ